MAIIAKINDALELSSDFVTDEEVPIDPLEMRLQSHHFLFKLR